MSSRYIERFTHVETVLLIEKHKIDMHELRMACSYGMPEELRPLGWRLLLNFLPTERHTWKQYLSAQRTNYDALVDQLIVNPEKSQKDDHPLSECGNSEWNQFFSDNTTLAQIDKDVRRLCPEIQFFQQNTAYPHKTGSTVNLSTRVTGQELPTQELQVDKFGITNLKATTRKRASSEYCTDKGCEKNWQVVERILFIYSKLNPGVKYVQGMNEVIGPIYFVFATDRDAEWAEYAEADTFYCFQQLMSEIKDHFIRTLDDSNCGIEMAMSSFHQLLSSFDPSLHTHLVKDLGILPQYYAFRWLSLMLSQEFALPDVINIWDSLFADPCRFSLLPYVCLSMLESQREYLLTAEFADTLRLLQNYPEGIDVGRLIVMAHDIRDGKISSIGENIEKKSFVGRAMSFGDRIKEFAREIKK